MILVPYLVLSDIRRIQSIMRTSSNKTYDSFMTNHKERLTEALDKLEVVETFLKDSIFTETMMEHFVKLSSNILVPIMQINYSEPLLYSSKNASVADLVSVFQSTSQKYFDHGIDHYNVTRDSFDFLLICKFY